MIICCFDVVLMSIWIRIQITILMTILFWIRSNPKFCTCWKINFFLKFKAMLIYIYMFLVMVIGVKMLNIFDSILKFCRKK
jgi:hypothetical protein